MKHRPSILAHLQDLLSLNCYKATFGDIANKIKRLHKPERLQLIRLCKVFFANPRYRIHEPTKVAISKVCIALLPDSLNLIKQWLKCKSGKGIYDVHFTLFVFSYEVQNFQHLRRFAQKILKLMEFYMIHTNTDKSQAVWMAGESLGDDWNISDSLTILIRVVKNAQSIPAKEAALHGLSHAITKVSGQDAKLIATTLERFVKLDSNRR